MWKFNLSEWMMGGSSEPPVVRFVRDFRTDGIEKVTLVGSSEDLGFWELDHGVAMEKVDDSKGLWSTPLLPVSSKHIEYKYAVKLAGKAKEEWFPSGPNKKLSEENLRKVTDREAVVDDTSIHTSFQLLVRNASPSQVRLVGSPPELGSWDLSKSKSLYQVKNNVWQTEVSFERSTPPFQYKFVCKNRDGEYEWEKDPNRNGDLSKTNVRKSNIPACSIVCRLDEWVWRESSKRHWVAPRGQNLRHPETDLRKSNLRCGPVKTCFTSAIHSSTVSGGREA
mmetsp:Transcript_14559/g.59020  ORF Transcript_14559/g.59020 Transcript_14559/m.59020 type:complete len:280 (-) Transcript_14559:5438-6277(-)